MSDTEQLVSGKVPNFVEEEERVLAKWKKMDLNTQIQAIRKAKNHGMFIFLEGPPTANGMPHMGHFLTRIVKDIYLRYKTMTGYYVSPRIGGWDTHGLPVEIEVEKMLGFTEGKKQIESYGVQAFNKLCRESVFKYVKEWEDMSTRCGFHLDLPNSYITLKTSYMESVWWSLSELYKKGLIYKGAKIVPYCPRCGTPLSSHEVAQGYQEDTEDPSIYVYFKLKSYTNRYILVWTTTPWTLLSNLLLAVKPDENYVVLSLESKEVVMAKALVPTVFKSKKPKVIEEIMGQNLVDLEYEPIFEYTGKTAEGNKQGKKHYVTSANFVTMEDGTGIVHCAPAFGLDDYELVTVTHGIPVFNPVDLEGKFVSTVPEFGGMFVKDADQKIIDRLVKEGKMHKYGKIKHTYPFCWRCDSPLLYYALETWFIAMSRFRTQLQANNQKIFWKPEHLKDGRFGNFLDEVKDWALSRNRYWGTPLPIWTCTKGHEFVIGSIKELCQVAKIPFDPKLDLHIDTVDKLEVHCPKCNAKAKREPYVIDCWYDSGAAFFAQWHYPFENEKAFEQHFPVDFITEAIDQTRGWFYTLHAISTVLFNKPAYMRCLTMGHILAENGTKMSKSRGTAISPNEVFSTLGADVCRWYLYSTPVWRSSRFSFDLVRKNARAFQVLLWNVLSFYDTYSQLDKYVPGENAVIPYEKRPKLDRYLISSYNSMLKKVHAAMEDLEQHRAVEAIEHFLDSDLSNWWLRRSRRRFWEKTSTTDKQSAYDTFHEVLAGLTRVLAPFIPFTAESFYERLVLAYYKDVPESVHLTDYPEANDSLIVKSIEDEVELVKEIITAGRNIRQEKDIKNRQPLAKATVIVNEVVKPQIEQYLAEITEELNVKEFEFASVENELITYAVTPQYKLLGPKFRANANKVANSLKQLASEQVTALASALKEKGEFNLSIDGESFIVTSDLVEIVQKTKEGLECAPFSKGQVFLTTTLTDELLLEGIARDIIRRIATMRRDLDMPYDAPVTIQFTSDSPLIKNAVSSFKDLIMAETLAKGLNTSVKDNIKEWEIIDVHKGVHKITIGLKL